jgi:hypothetical protein
MNLTQEEIKVLKTLQQNTQKLTNEFGLIKLAQMSLDKREEEAIKLLNTVKSEEKQVVEALEKKYGRGSIDIDQGTFTPM